MRLLFDENLSESLCMSLADTYPGSLHVRSLGLQGFDDVAIASYAVANHLVIVSKDSDFVDPTLLGRTQLRVVWLRIGNCTTAQALFTLRNNSRRVEEFLGSEDAVLELFG